MYIYTIIWKTKCQFLAFFYQYFIGKDECMKGALTILLKINVWHFQEVQYN